MDVKIAGLATSVRSTAVVVLPAATKLPATALPTRRSIYVFNNAAAGGASMYVGDSTVTTSTGTPIPAQAGLSIDLAPNVILYGVVASSSNDVRVLEAA